MNIIGILGGMRMHLLVSWLILLLLVLVYHMRRRHFCLVWLQVIHLVHIFICVFIHGSQVRLVSVDLVRLHFMLRSDILLAINCLVRVVGNILRMGWLYLVHLVLVDVLRGHLIFDIVIVIVIIHRVSIWVLLIHHLQWSIHHLSRLCILARRLLIEISIHKMIWGNTLLLLLILIVGIHS